MKHIKEFLEYRKHQLEYGEPQRQLRLFVPLHEKGSNEWTSFNSIRHDRTDGYLVRIPKKKLAVRPGYIRLYPAHQMQ